MSPLGTIHIIFGIAALVAGTAVVLTRKGTRSHRTLGHVYFTSMLALNGTALAIYELFGTFGPFHWMALASLATLAVGMVPILTRRPKGGWLELHAGFMTGSYVGLVAAFLSEITSRLPGGGSGFSATAVAVTTVLTIAIGALLIRRGLPGAIRGINGRSRSAS